LFLFFVLVVIQNRNLRLLLFGVCGLGLSLAPYWIPFVVKYNPFWLNVYEKHGSLGLILSLRNENVNKVFEGAGNLDFFSLIFGGISRYPTVIEMFPFDMFIYFGGVGILLCLMFYIFWVPSVKIWIPVFVSVFSGVLYELVIGMVILGLWREEESYLKKD